MEAVDLSETLVVVVVKVILVSDMKFLLLLFCEGNVWHCHMLSYNSQVPDADVQLMTKIFCFGMSRWWLVELSYGSAGTRIII